MGLLETETFELWMSKIMERFDRHEQMLSKLAGKEIKEVKYLDGERLLDNQDLCQLLQASKRSLQRYLVPARCATRCYGIKSITRNRTCRSS